MRRTLLFADMSGIFVSKFKTPSSDMEILYNIKIEEHFMKIKQRLRNSKK